MTPDDPDDTDQAYVVDCGSGNRGKKYAVHIYNVLNTAKRDEWSLTRDKNRIYVRGPEAEDDVDAVLGPHSHDTYDGRKIDYTIEPLYEETGSAPYNGTDDLTKDELREERDELARLLKSTYEEKERYRQRTEELEQTVDSLTYLQTTVDGAITTVLDAVGDQIRNREQPHPQESVETYREHSMALLTDGDTTDELAAFADRLDDGFDDLPLPVIITDESDTYDVAVPYGSPDGPLSLFIGTAMHEAVNDTADRRYMDDTAIHVSLPADQDWRLYAQDIHDTFTSAVNIDLNIQYVDTYTGEPRLDPELVDTWEQTSGVGQKTVDAVEQFIDEEYSGDKPVSAFLEDVQHRIITDTPGLGATRMQRIIDAAKQYEDENG